MQDALGVVIFVVVAVGSIAAIAGLLTTSRTYEDIGKGGLFEDRAHGEAAAATPDGARDDEIRQLLTARNARHAARGRDTVDVEAELDQLTRPAADPELEAEVRELVESRNRRLVARGRPPLDVDAEVARRLRDLRA